MIKKAVEHESNPANIGKVAGNPSDGHVRRQTMCPKAPLRGIPKQNGAFPGSTKVLTVIWPTPSTYMNQPIAKVSDLLPCSRNL
mmetsp:Transcript_8175/g.24550  ORF Transcript_8175/g.24550 Transcript_8175/m.24550 type:complete len:84 (+) Transcript_8175:456-707(+)